MKVRVGAGIWLLAGALVSIIILVLALFLIVFPQKNQASSIDKDIQTTETNIQQEKNRLNQLKQYEKDPEQFTRQIDAIKEKVPENVELADVIQQIDQAAEESGLDFYSFKPDAPVKVSSYYSVTCESVFHGRYFNLVEFFNQIERLPRSIKVVKLDLKADETGLPYLEITINFRFFFTTDNNVQQLLNTK
jgi:Tfp pilus assembly protein PilO